MSIPAQKVQFEIYSIYSVRLPALEGGEKLSITYFTFSVVTIPVPEQILPRNK